MITESLKKEIESLRSLNDVEKFLQNSRKINEGILGSVIGGVAGFALGKPLMIKLCEILGIRKNSVL